MLIVVTCLLHLVCSGQSDEFLDQISEDTRFVRGDPLLHDRRRFSSLEIPASLLGRSAISIVEEDKRCFACPILPDTGMNTRCIIPCHYNQRCYLKANHANATRKSTCVRTPPARRARSVSDRRCTDERWVRDLLVDGCLTYNEQYWCMCSTDLCNSGDFVSIRGTYESCPSLASPHPSFPLGYDDCSNDPCPSGTTCLDTKDGFTCICPPWQDDCTYCESSRRMNERENLFVRCSC